MVVGNVIKLLNNLTKRENVQKEEDQGPNPEAHHKLDQQALTFGG